MVRFKNRWLLVEFIPCTSSSQLGLSQATARLAATQTTARIDAKQVYAALKQSVIANFGDTGWGAVGSSLTVKYYSPTTNTCIIRVARDHHRIAWAAVTLLSSIGGAKIVPNVVKLSGTVKQAQLAAIMHNRTVVARYRTMGGLPALYQDSYDSFLEKSRMEIEAMRD
ncbi:hypothetical protein SERLA73DRAFT_182356 [Serpula lacrymans var. lacrymans S7.3]|uniref:Ribonuclease P/MRP protein subunit POP5 n=2 Tax=Serpula lacrymans var. lacrymans TaxID=341189 RepID=F8PX16_SERL3|nr:uncharacterized protein SERLADRAFT_468963 [Serpula lacrymans var. lacrymans S7.9]EGN99395.1 hypothetical protein SERLA73DRAFT_182356 [Serpula lacrymans var. lacrymans S7.3]EGO24957.1 hypothetical protein SERLADRAFT_468963 [Serpula lacrymans var. lacrymans S7.9]